MSITVVAGIFFYLLAACVQWIPSEKEIAHNATIQLSPSSQALIDKVNQEDQIKDEIQVRILIALQRHPRTTDIKSFRRELSNLNPPIIGATAEYNLRQIEKQGYMEILAPSGSGKPERYNITEKGLKLIMDNGLDSDSEISC